MNDSCEISCSGGCDHSCERRVTWNPTKSLKTPSGRIVGGRTRVTPRGDGSFRLTFLVEKRGFRPRLITITKSPMIHMEVAA